MHRSRRHVCAARVVWPLGCLILLWIGATRAATAGTDSAGPALEAPAHDPIESPGPIHDRYLVASDAPLDISTDDTVSSDPSGLARSLRIDAVAGDFSAHAGGVSDHSTESGVQLNGQWDSRSLGSWSLDFADRIQGDELYREGRGLWRLSERGLPFDGGWRMDAAAGDLNLPLISLARTQSRFFLPSAATQGVATAWSGPSGLEVVAAGGEPGIYNGVVVPSFATLGGSTETLGAQWSPSAKWTLGGQFIAAQDVTPMLDFIGIAESRQSLNSGLLSATWQDGGTRAQVNVLDGGATDALGAWLDVSMAHGGEQQNFGVFRIDPQVTWGNQIVSRDLQGTYYQGTLQNRRGFIDFGVDQAWSVSGNSPETTFGTIDGRYQWARDIGTGGAINARSSGGSFAWSAQAYLDLVNDWGTGRGQIGYAHADTERGLSATLNQNWSVSAGAHVATSIGFVQVTRPGDTQSSYAADIALNATADLTSRLSVDANVRWDRALSGPTPSAITANVAIAWQFARNWSLLANLYDVRIGTWTAVTVYSPLEPPINTINPSVDQRSMFLTVRYQRAAGQHFAPLGGVAGSGSGELSGTIYMDANDNGVLDAGEGTPANVTVVLDGRYSVQTDRNGHFEFRAVAAGRHQIRIIPDNLPLPWTVADDGRVDVQVSTRSHTDVKIPVTRHSLVTRQAEN